MPGKSVLYILLLPVVVSLATVMCSCVADDEPARQWALSVGDTLPSFEVQLDNGKTVSTSSLLGKAVMIVFFNTSCSDCRRELPQVQQTFEAVGNDPEVEIFAISRAQDFSSVSQYWIENGLTLPFSAQDDESLFNLFASRVIPRIFIADPKGVIIASYSDVDMPDSAELTETLGKALFH